MANTLTYSDACNLVGQVVSRKLEDSFQAYLINIATNYLWNVYDWRETIAELPPFYLQPNEQDHGKPIYTVPVDFKGLRDPVHIMQISGDGLAQEYDIGIQKNLGLTRMIGVPEKIAYVPETQSFRIYPRVPESVGTDWIVTGKYKKRPAVVTLNDLTVNIPWDDSYFHVFVEVLKWAYYGSIGHPKTQEQLEYANRLIMQMMNQEGADAGDVVVSPNEPLVWMPYVDRYW